MCFYLWQKALPKYSFVKGNTYNFGEKGFFLDIMFTTFKGHGNDSSAWESEIVYRNPTN